ncbi:lipid IV(A) 4-amino-4-deoxy-L-arabinosyltransferase [Pantoea sp. Aalb]|uniref:lipid IV(A) 4-amino-4-deoxy-L-arabinosyltransferase n=1 Tax=Pantoea sp. Aalb TaxID=2576762 RepID=UPI00132BDBE3|nr:lipid IV(A) 4-amino-4-deoxy-L-arabinosyltransferase [Pantoea sp. Aalb]MXP67999.1 lipid IV(A) 4-amino-4-deoxy-L-arabinosyltransferase [Pantoea sp. Aalb]
MITRTKAALLTIVFALYYIVPIEFRDLWQPDEVRYAEISREMLTSIDWIVPHFLGLRYFEKPIAGYWINNFGQLLFGHTNFGVRSGAIINTTLSALLLYWLGKQIFSNNKVALTGSIIFLTFLLVYIIGTYAVLDPILLLWLVSAMCSYWLAVQAISTKQRLLGYILLGIACAIGFMTKGFIAFVIPILAITPWAIWQRRFIELLIWGSFSIFIAILLSAPWALEIYRREEDFWNYFFWVEHIQRFANFNAQHKAPFWYYIPILCIGCLPWLGLLPGALISAWLQRKKNIGIVYLLSWMVLPLLFFSLSKGKLPTYILPCFAPLALLMAQYIYINNFKIINFLKINGLINLLFGLISTFMLLTVFAPWGLRHYQIYNKDEKINLLCSVIAFSSWAMIGWLSIKLEKGLWQWSALCPLGMALMIGYAIPEEIKNTKQPQSFIRVIKNQLKNSRYLLTNTTGMASTIAWMIQRSDIILYNEPGELEYGLSYPDAKMSYVDGDVFESWLQEHRCHGKISLIFILKQTQIGSEPNLPKPDHVYRQGRLAYYGYDAVPCS